MSHDSKFPFSVVTADFFPWGCTSPSPPPRKLSSVQLLSCVCLFATPWTAAHQASLSITHSQSLLKFMSFESVMPSNHLLLSHPLLLLPSIFPSIGAFSNESSVEEYNSNYLSKCIKHDCKLPYFFQSMKWEYIIIIIAF